MEPIEKWREEFEAFSDEVFTNKFPSGVYNWSFMEERWTGFLMAKRSQPAVELPNKDFYFTGKNESKTVFYYCPEEIYKALESAGIQYRIKGE